MNEESKESIGIKEVKVKSDVSSVTVDRTTVHRRPKTVHNKRGNIKGRRRPNTVHSNTGLARERSKFLKAEKREQKIDEELTKKEKRRGRQALEKLEEETRKGVIHGNAKRVFYSRLKTSLSSQNKSNLYDSLLLLEVLSDDSDNHFDILHNCLLQAAALIVNSLKDWNLKIWKYIYSVATTIKNLLEASTRRGYRGGNNSLIYKQHGLLVLVRAACADLFLPSGNQYGSSMIKSAKLLPQWSTSASEHDIKSNRLSTGSVTPSIQPSPLLLRYAMRAQRTAFQSLHFLATLPKNRPSLIRSRVLEVAMLVMGGRKKQLEILKRLKLTEGVPRFEGSPTQLAAYQLVQNFEAKDYELMSRLQQSRDVNKKFQAADQLLSTLMSGKSTGTHHRPSTVPISLGRPFFQPKHVTQTKDGSIKILKGNQLHIVRGDVSGKRDVKVWEPLVKLLQKPEIMDQLHTFAEEEFEYSRLVEERRLKKEYATRTSQIDNSKLRERIRLKTHMEKIRYRCSAEGVMEDIRRRNGLLKEDSWWSNKSRKKVAYGLTHKTKKKKRILEKEESIASVSDGLPDLCFDFAPPQHPGRSPFGHCATNGVAWWENYLIKKPRPTREILAKRPVDVELDTEPISLRPVEEDIRLHAVEPNALMIPRLHPGQKNRKRPNTVHCDRRVSNITTTHKIRKHGSRTRLSNQQIKCKRGKKSRSIV